MSPLSEMAPSLRADDASSARLSLEQISLVSFRNYQDLQVRLSPAPVILTGSNGSGKTNLLEAVSFLVPGKGLRRAATGDIQNLRVSAPWVVAVDLLTPMGPLKIGTGRDPDDHEGDRRIVHIDGKVSRGQTKLSGHVAMAWITPEMDRLLADGASGRRKFLDRLAYSFDAAHGARVTRYEKALRERLRLLRDGPFDAHWLTAIEDELAQSGVAIAAARRQLIQELGAAIAETHSAFPRADLALKGIAEEALQDQPALLVEDKLREAYAQSRGEDAQAGISSVGPHRSDLVVTHCAKNCPAHLCSTGEQKALLIAIMLAYVRTLTRHRQRAPLFLLDDIAAHLDDTRRRALFEEILELNVQAWMTGTDVEPFDAMIKAAQHFTVEQGHLR